VSSGNFCDFADDWALIQLVRLRAGCLGPEECRQSVVTVRDPEHRPAWLQGDAGVERPSVYGVESEPIDELHDRGNRDGVIPRSSHGETTGRARRTPSLLKREVAEVVEALDQRR
jgi:hypothetical protein